MDILEPQKTTILVIDDTPENLDVLIEHLKNAKFNILVALNGKQAIKITKKKIPDMILLDIKMPEMDGFETCRLLKQNEALKDTPVIFLTVSTEKVDKLEGFSVGGVDYITKPYDHEEILARIKIHLTIRCQQQLLLQKNTKLLELNEQLKQEIARREQAEEALSTTSAQLSAISQEEAKRWGLSAFIGQSQAIKKVLVDIRRLQKLDKTNTLILGESGTGKELIARAIHFGGTRTKGPFIPVNCSTIPEQLSESSFFGHIKGAFTGASTSHKGYFEQAQGGSLFLDEIGDMPLSLQAKLLRTIEDRLITPVGGEQSKSVDIRLIAATSVNLSEKANHKQFRQDLLFRLTNYTINIPPLRERKEDIIPLTKHFLSLFAKEMGHKKNILTLPTQTILENYHFPGNVRELKNLIEHAMIKSDGVPIQPNHLHFIDFTNNSGSQIYGEPKEFDTESNEEKILNYVRQHGSIDNAQCRQLLDYDLHQVSYLLKKMHQDKLLVREGKRRWAIYRLPESNK